MSNRKKTVVVGAMAGGLVCGVGFKLALIGLALQRATGLGLM